MSKHTPGPWVALPEEVNRNYIRIRGTVLGSRYKIANVIMPYFDYSKEREAQETRANAKMIVAVTDFYSLLLEILDKDSCSIYSSAIERSDGMKCFKEWEIRARAAIAKATGETL